MANVIDLKIKEDFQRAIDNAVKEVGDLTIPLKSISKRWYQGNKSIFTLKGPGKYADLSEKYKKTKQKKLGFTYPVLLGANGRIKSAITDPSNENAVNYIVNKKTLVLGTEISKSLPYARAHHLGSPKQNIPARPLLFTGAEQIRPDGMKNIVEIYKQILNDYVVQKTTGNLP